MFEQLVKKLLELAENQGDWENHCDVLYKDSDGCMLDIMSFFIKSGKKMNQIILFDDAHHDKVY